MFNVKQFKAALVGVLLPLILSFSVAPVVNFDINISPERPSVEFSEGEKSCSKDDNFKIRRNFRLKSNRPISTGKALMMYLRISRRMKRFIKATSKKKSEKQ